MSENDEASNAIPAPETGKRLTWKSIVTTLKDIKEMILFVTLLTGGALWIISYFATREQLDKLECHTKINVRMLQAAANANHAEQLLKQTRAEKREQARLLEQSKHASSSKKDATDMVKSVEGRLDALIQEEKTHHVNMEGDRKVAQKALVALTQNSCLDREQRIALLGQLARGEF